jgi:hypothetical protein
MKKQLLTLITLAFTTVLSAQIPNYVPANGLVGWWPFNGNANDESGNGNNGTVNGATLTTDRFGVANKAYGFDGNDKIEIPILFNENERTISIWFLRSISNGILQTVIDNDHPQLTFGSSGVSVRSDDTLQPNFGGAFCVMQEQPNQIWTNVVVSRSNIETNFYLNGELVCVESNGNVNSAFATNQNVKIGCTRMDDRFFYGSIDDIGIWNRALTACEIQDLYNAQLGSSTTSSTQTQTPLDSYTWPVNGQTYTQSGMYYDTLTNAAGCDSVITLDLTLSFTGIEQIQYNASKKLAKITDLNGKETPFKKNTVLLFVYEDGTMERVYITE